MRLRANKGNVKPPNPPPERISGSVTRRCKDEVIGSIPIKGSS